METFDTHDFLIDFQYENKPTFVNGVKLHQIGKRFCRADTVVPPHLHIDWFEFTVILSGKGKIYTNSETEYVDVEEGDVFLSFPTDIHSIVSNPHAPVKYNFFSFSFTTSPYKAEFEKITRNFYEQSKRLFRDDNLVFLIDMLLAELMGNAFAKQTIVQSVIEQILIFTCRNFLHNPTKKTPMDVSKKELLCYKLTRYIDANIFSIKRFEDIAKHLHYNYSYLSKIFKQTTNVTIADYLTQKKLERAKILITEGKLSLTKIAEILNYSSLYSFSKSFKYHFGISPKQYQKTQSVK